MKALTTISATQPQKSIPNFLVTVLASCKRFNITRMRNGLGGEILRGDGREG
jgi:hypothetical protein